MADDAALGAQDAAARDAVGAMVREMVLPGRVDFLAGRAGLGVDSSPVLKFMAGSVLKDAFPALDSMSRVQEMVREMVLPGRVDFLAGRALANVDAACSLLTTDDLARLLGHDATTPDGAKRPATEVAALLELAQTLGSRRTELSEYQRYALKVFFGTLSVSMAADLCVAWSGIWSLMDSAWGLWGVWQVTTSKAERYLDPDEE